MQHEIERFVAAHRKRWSPLTILRYRWYLRNFAEWLGESGLTSRPEDVTEAMMLRWFDARMAWAASTQYLATVALRAFFRWTVGRQDSPAEKLVLPRRSYRPGRSLDEGRLLRILAALDTSRAKGIRDTAIVVLLLDTGLRAAEVCRLREDDLDTGERHFSVRIKGGRWADGVFSPYTAACLIGWLAVRAEYARPDALELFVSLGGIHRGEAITADGLRTVFRHIGKRTGFHFSPHDFRRSFATMALKSGAPSRLVQVAGRWSSIHEVERYSQSLQPRDFDGYSPVSRVMGFRVKDEES